VAQGLGPEFKPHYHKKKKKVEEEEKLLLFANDILCVENFKDSSKRKVELIKFSKLSEYKINMQKPYGCKNITKIK
jgi:hypothetical protein